MEPVETFPMMFLGYGVIWGLILGYCIYLGYRHRSAISRIEEIKEKFIQTHQTDY